jgi:hypothetical protein
LLPLLFDPTIYPFQNDRMSFTEGTKITSAMDIYQYESLEQLSLV